MSHPHCAAYNYKHKGVKSNFKVVFDFTLLFFFFFFLLWRYDPARVMASSFSRFLDHTQRRTTVGRTPLDKWLPHCRDLYVTIHNTHNRQTSMPPVGFEPTISAGQRPQTYTLDCAATWTAWLYSTCVYNSFLWVEPDPVSEMLCSVHNTRSGTDDWNRARHSRCNGIQTYDLQTGFYTNTPVQWMWELIFTQESCLICYSCSEKLKNFFRVWINYG